MATKLSKVLFSHLGNNIAGQGQIMGVSNFQPIQPDKNFSIYNNQSIFSLLNNQIRKVQFMVYRAYRLSR